jgi:gamma-glutamyl phosphate reductase
MITDESFYFYFFVLSCLKVLGHADGVCHVFVDASADKAKATKICVDAKVTCEIVVNFLDV